ncbi:MAG: PLP-dependent aminotransferase family protein [Anaerolineaceae bacterium]|nr:PLP-dependent aminotransferase family protein [Anaerolineaceae bacterium]
MSSNHLVQTTQMHVDPAVIDLGVGQPQLSLLPLERIRRAAEKRFAQGEAGFLQYGAEQGDGYLRAHLARFLTQEYAFPVTSETLFITNGASSGLDLACTLYTRPGDTIFVEEPSYFLALRIFADHHLRLVPLPVDEDGLVIEAVEEALKTERPVMLYTIPTFQNPSGYTLSESRRIRLAQLSRQYDFLIVADEVYHLLNFTAQLPPAFAAYTGEGNILSLGSFSKILAPGLRLGWVQTDPERARAFAACGLVDSGGGLNPFTAAIVRGLFETGEMKENIQHLCAVYQARVAAMHAALHSHIPGAGYQVPQGGYFFWIRLPGGRDAEPLMAHAEKFKVSFRPGVRFSSQGGLRDYARLCFAFYEADQLAEGIQRLARALE